MNWYYHTLNPEVGEALAEVKKTNVAKLPLHIPQNSNKGTSHDQMVKIVERMFELNKQLQAAKTSHGKNSLQRQMEATDRRIDQLVYKLYDLTDKEIEIVESSGSQR